VEGAAGCEEPVRRWNLPNNEDTRRVDCGRTISIAYRHGPFATGMPVDGKKIPVPTGRHLRTARHPLPYARPLARYPGFYSLGNLCHTEMAVTVTICARRTDGAGELCHAC